ncbi:hypothetical protein CYMTET_32679 [Cymbomonas tetramitiformis]|uniref:Centromere protein X n=1 Tax=Cymbomonas tetramitiformis TaxID=36881 RepID=A0AAE0FEY5_9CHLO|nr:hypothetical protein CYMTET_32679 [Cymbomonas tetramitiformis]
MAGFKPELLGELFKLVWEQQAQSEYETVLCLDEENDKRGNARTPTASKEALRLSAELLKLFVMEAVDRASACAKAQGDDQVEASHFERILPQLLLDF